MRKVVTLNFLPSLCFCPEFLIFSSQCAGWVVCGEMWTVWQSSLKQLHYLFAFLVSLLLWAHMHAVCSRHYEHGVQSHHRISIWGFFNSGFYFVIYVSRKQFEYFDLFLFTIMPDIQFLVIFFFFLLEVCAAALVQGWTLLHSWNTGAEQRGGCKSKRFPWFCLPLQGLE